MSKNHVTITITNNQALRLYQELAGGFYCDLSSQSERAARAIRRKVQEQLIENGVLDEPQ